MKYTSNYTLKKPDLTDIVNIDDFNTNVDKIDTELKKINDNATILSSQMEQITQQNSVLVKPNGIDDTLNLKNALKMNKKIILENEGVYNISENLLFTINTSSIINIEGNNATLKSLKDNIKIIEIPSYYTDRRLQHTIKDLIIDCNNKNSIGLYIDNTTNLNLDNLTIQNSLDTGMYLNGTQFCNFRNIQLLHNKVGLYLANKLVEGGGNTNSFCNVNLYCNEVGMILNRVTEDPLGMGNNYFYNVIPIGNTVCSMAFFNQNVLNIVSDLCPEVNGQGDKDSITYNGLKIPKSGLYMKKSVTKLRNLVNNDVTPQWGVLEEDSILSIDNIYSYGSPYDYQFSCDNTSKISLINDFNSKGIIPNVISYPNLLDITARLSFIGYDNTYLDKTIQNDTKDIIIPNFTSVGGSIANNRIIDEEMVREIHFSNTESNINTNYAYYEKVFNCYTNKKYNIIGFTIKSNVTCDVNIIIGDPSFNYIKFRCISGIKYRIYMMNRNENMLNSPMKITIDNNNSSVILSLSSLISLNTDNIADVNKILKGAYNNNSTNLYSFTSYPNWGQWKKGDIVYNIGTVNTGTPNGWIYIGETIGNTDWRNLGLIP